MAWHHKRHVMADHWRRSYKSRTSHLIKVGHRPPVVLSQRRHKHKLMGWSAQLMFLGKLRPIGALVRSMSRLLYMETPMTGGRVFLRMRYPWISKRRMQERLNRVQDPTCLWWLSMDHSFRSNLLASWTTGRSPVSWRMGNWPSLMKVSSQKELQQARGSCLKMREVWIWSKRNRRNGCFHLIHVKELLELWVEAWDIICKKVKWTPRWQKQLQWAAAMHGACPLLPRALNGAYQEVARQLLLSFKLPSKLWQLSVILPRLVWRNVLEEVPPLAKLWWCLEVCVWLPSAWWSLQQVGLFQWLKWCQKHAGVVGATWTAKSHGPVAAAIFPKLSSRARPLDCAVWEVLHWVVWLGAHLV